MAYYLAAQPDHEWAAAQVETFPLSWAEKLLARWGRKQSMEHHKQPLRYAANLELLKSSRAIKRAHHVGVPADANDGQICQEAQELARDTIRRLDYLNKQAGLQLAELEPAKRERLTMLGLLMEATYWLSLRGVEGFMLAHAVRSISGALRRVGCERWWRSVLRRLHARAVETTARAIGLVNKRAGCYVSNESLARRQGQRLRNERALESVRAVNEHGQDYTLAELAAKGPANRQIRRHELMTRIAGFELIAKECGHDAYFVTITCPSRMHAWRTRPGQSWAVEENPNYDGVTQVDQAQEYLCTQWRRFNAAAARAGLEQYGFRIAEPNHDGTPHWHALLFFPKMAHSVGSKISRRRPGYRVAVRLLRRYFLWNAAPEERGAKQHRVKLERIDWTRGSAAGYVAKYVSKNIDGYKVEKDLYGNDTLTSSQRVDAWASTWRIRQFQQVGGAPVGVWRELRRLHPDQEAASPTVALALDAVNLAAREQEAHSELMQRYTAANAFAAYLHLQGGHRVTRRAQRLHVLRESTGELGRYGEVMAPRAVGVVTVEAKKETVGIATFTRHIRREVESERASWIVVPAGFVEQARQRLRTAPASSEAARPWSPVNNCTRPAPLFCAAVVRTKKRGRWHRWKTPAGGTPATT